MSGERRKEREVDGLSSVSSPSSLASRISFLDLSNATSEEDWGLRLPFFPFFLFLFFLFFGFMLADKGVEEGRMGEGGLETENILIRPSFNSSDVIEQLLSLLN